MRHQGKRKSQFLCTCLDYLQLYGTVKYKSCFLILRYLFVRWRLNVENMFVFLGESGDTDFEEMLSGTHKTIIMKGVAVKGSEELLRTSGSYLKDDIVPPESPFITFIDGEASADQIACALRHVSRTSAGM